MPTKRIPALILAAVILAIVGALFFAATSWSHRDGAPEAPASNEAAPTLPASSSSPPSIDAPVLVESRDVLPRAEAGASGLEVLVLGPSSAPISDATILLFRGEEVLDKGSTDANGLASFAAREGAGEYLLAAAGRRVERGEIELAAGRRTIQLVEGVVVAGTVTVDGAPPAPAMELSWTPTQAGDVIGGLPPAIRTAWYGTARKSDTITAVTNADGAFTLRGMPEQASGVIRWSEAYFPEGASQENDEREFAVPVPRTDLSLRLIAGFQLRLRVVDFTGAPLPGARIELSLEGNASTSMSTSSRQDGRFVYSFLPDAFEKLSVKVSAQDKAGSRSYDFVPPAERRGVWDVGDLATGATREVSVFVKDVDARPIQDARVSAAAVPLQQSNRRTDAEGFVKFVVGAEETAISAGALGYSSMQVAIPANCEATATLARVCMLVLQLPDNAAVPKGVAIEVKGSAPLFASEDSATRTDVVGWMSNTNAGITTFTTLPKESSRWKVSGLLSGLALQAKLRGGAKELCVVEVPPLAPGEWRTVELNVDATARSLTVRVLSPAGRPLSDATVSLFVRSGNTTSYHSSSVDEKGEVELRDLYGDDCTFFAESKSCARKFVTLRPIPDRTFEIVLEPSHSVEVELVRRDGSLVLDPAQVFVEAEGPPTERAKALGQGRYQLGGLPSGEAQVTVHSSSGSVSRLIDASVPFVRIVVGESSFLTVTVPRIGEKEVDDWRIGVAEVGASRDFSRASLRWLAIGGATAAIQGLLPGKYEVWLEKPAGASKDIWARTGEPASVTITAEQPTARMEL